ncbi:4117_t:CDS:2, partial [Funneliformis geosporum]
KNVQGIVHVFTTNFSELRIKKYHNKSDSVKKAYGFRVSYTNPKFEQRMINFFRKVDMIIFIIEPISKSNENIVSLSQAIKVNFFIIKAGEISDIANANILNCETTKFLENKLKKTLKEICSLN